MIKLPNLLRRKMTGSLLTTGAIAAAVLFSPSAVQAAKLDTLIKNFKTGANSFPIEQVVVQAIDLANLIGTGQIKLSNKNVKTLAQTSADALIAKLTLNLNDNLVNPSNVVDEIGEVAAYITNSIAAAPKFTKFSKAKKAMGALVQGALKSAKSGPLLTGASVQVFRDVMGSVGLTLVKNSLTTGSALKFQKFLDKKAKKYAGKANKSSYLQGSAEGFSGNPPVGPNGQPIYEDGNIANNALIPDGPSTDGTESDFRAL